MEQSHDYPLGSDFELRRADDRIGESAGCDDMIFKLQRSLFTTADCEQVLIYNEDKSVMGQFPLTRKLKALFKRDEFKNFVVGRLVGTEVNIERRAKWREW